MQVEQFAGAVPALDADVDVAVPAGLVTGRAAGAAGQVGGLDPDLDGRPVRHSTRWYPGWPRPGQASAAGRDAGNAALELLILAPVLILLICMVIAAGRIAIARGSIDAAARDAARQASIARSPASALSAAQASASAELAGEHLNCSALSVSLPEVNSEFATPLGQPASVTATVRCTVSLSDLILPGMPGSVPLTFTFRSPLDPFRGRA